MFKLLPWTVWFEQITLTKPSQLLLSQEQITHFVAKNMSGGKTFWAEETNEPRMDHKELNWKGPLPVGFYFNLWLLLPQSNHHEKRKQHRWEVRHTGRRVNDMAINSTVVQLHRATRKMIPGKPALCSSSDSQRVSLFPNLLSSSLQLDTGPGWKISPRMTKYK